ncbi:MAG: hypothetical protein K6T17_05025 [Fimbriimonadales bacterium]|nr:hypothetical protein [Fimbriimonadales bacterium]
MLKILYGTSVWRVSLRRVFHFASSGKPGVLGVSLLLLSLHCLPWRAYDPDGLHAKEWRHGKIVL